MMVPFAAATGCQTIAAAIFGSALALQSSDPLSSVTKKPRFYCAHLYHVAYVCYFVKIYTLSSACSAQHHRPAMTSTVVIQQRVSSIMRRLYRNAYAGADRRVGVPAQCGQFQSA